MKNKIDLTLSSMMDGAVQELFEAAVEKVLENIQNLNTEAEKVRKVNLEIVFKPNDSRTMADISCTAKTKLEPYTPIKSTLITDFRNGEVAATELKSGAIGQTFVDIDTGEVLQDNGEPIESEKVTDINVKKQWK